MLFNNCKAVRLVSAESQRVIPCSASTTKGITSENTITAVCLYLSMNLVEQPYSFRLWSSVLNDVLQTHRTLGRKSEE